MAASLYCKDKVWCSILLKILEHLLHEDPAGKGDGVANGGDHQAVILQRVLKPCKKLFQNSGNFPTKMKWEI